MWFTSHCDWVEIDPTRLATTYLQYRRAFDSTQLANFNIKKQSTIRVEWNFLRLRYKRETGRKIDELVGDATSEVIDSLEFVVNILSTNVL
jgi:hypothetical protein